jgi:CPA1 family monovalent cation:H+ antiporter
MHAVELALALMVAVAVLATVAQVMRLPYPILLVLGGLVLTLIPSVPSIQLAPDLVFLFFLPPLLYITAFDIAIRDVRANLRSILSLAVGLALATTVAVAAVVHLLMPQIGWPVAFALGAIVSPPDAVAAAAVFRHLDVPRRIATLLEDESLFNDATALVAYQAAIAAMTTATFSLPKASATFIVVGLGGVVLGFAVSALVVQLRSRLNDTPVEITVSLLTPFAAYLAAEQLHVSGVLATVTAGLGVSYWSPKIMSADTRLRSRAVWDMVAFMLNGLVFILIGLQLSTIIAAPPEPPTYSLPVLVGIGLLISLTTIIVRLAWLLVAAAISRGFGRPARWREALVAAWAGMRGVVSLATALALPFMTPERDALLVLTFVVILVTLVGQGLTLPLVVRMLGLDDDDNGRDQELHARTVAVAAAVGRIEQLANEWPGHLPLVDTLRVTYGHRAGHLNEKHAHEIDEDGQLRELDLGLDVLENGHSRLEAAEQELLEHRQIRRSVIDAERDAVLSLRQRGEITDEAWRRIERDLDLEELRMEA